MATLPSMAHRKSYGQFCPVAQAAEVVTERWTPLILRELFCGSRRFNEIRKGVPLMSPSLLATRLRQLEDAKVIERRGDDGRNAEYHLTVAGQHLQPVIEALGLWGHAWLRRELTPRDLDPAFLMWEIRRGIDTSALPKTRRTVVQVNLAGVSAKKARWWLLFDSGGVDLCLKRPGFEVDLEVNARIDDLVRVWLGDVPLATALSQGSIKLEGQTSLRRSFPKWFGPSRFAKLAQAHRGT